MIEALGKASRGAGVRWAQQQSGGGGVRLPLCRSSSLACLEGRGSNSSAKGKQARFRGSLWGRQRGAHQEPRWTGDQRAPLILLGEGDPMKAAKQGSSG